MATADTRVTTSQEAAHTSTLVVLCVCSPGAQDAVMEIKEALNGKIIVNCTNPVGANLGAVKSTAEQIQVCAPECTVVKSFNQIGFNIMDNPIIDGRKTVLFVASDSEEASTTVERLALELDFDVVQKPGLHYAYQLEAFAMMSITMSYKLGYGRESAFSRNQRQS